MSQFLMGRIKYEALSPPMQEDAKDLLIKVNALLNEFYGVFPHVPVRIITSGYRSPTGNGAAGGSPKSNHLLCRAIDLGDKDGLLDKWLDLYPEKLIDYDLYREASSATINWCHLSNFPPRSGRRTFYP